MQIDIKGRNVQVTDEMRRRVERRLDKVARQISPLARVELVLFREPNPAIADREVAEAILHLKGVTLRALESSPDMQRSLNMVTAELARQVKRHREKRRRRREQRTSAARQHAVPAPIVAPPSAA